MLEEHLGYVADRVRLDAFKKAVGKMVKAGDTVADLGCGTGILGLLCLEAGASRVWAIDSTAMLEIARESMARAGLSDKVQFVRGNSHRVDLPERVDVVICDHVGFFGFDYGIVQALQDARRRFLKPAGRILPRSIHLRLAAVQSEKSYAKADKWANTVVPPEFHWVRRHAVNAKQAVELGADDLLSGQASLGVIDLATDSPDFLSWSTQLRIERDGMLHGLAGWFECELAPDVWMTNSPCAAGAIDRSQAFLPINEPVPVKAGDVLSARIMTRLGDHLLAWTVDVPDAGRQFRHSTWQGMLWAPEDLVRSQPDRVPALSREGKARLAVLGCCDGRRTAREIEEQVLERYPDLFPSRDEISRFVAQALGWDTE